MGHDLLLLVFVPTFVVVYLAYIEGSGELARKLSASISEKAGVPVTVRNVSLEDLSLSRVKLLGFEVAGPIDSEYPLLNADEVAVTGYEPTSSDVSLDSITLSSYTIAVRTGSNGGFSSGEAFRKAARALLRLFVQKRLVGEVSLNRGRILLLTDKGDIEWAIRSGKVVREEGGTVTVEFSFDAVNSEDIGLSFSASVSGTPDKPIISVEGKLSPLELNTVEDSLIREMFDDFGCSGLLQASFSYQAGASAKDFLSIHASAEKACFTSDKLNAKGEKADITARYSSEHATYPDVERLFVDPLTAVGEYEFDLNVVRPSGTFEEFKLQSESLKVAKSGEDALVVMSELRGVYRENALSVGNLRGTLVYADGAYSFSSKQPLKAVSLKMADAKADFRTFDIEVSYDGKATDMKITAAPVEGGRVEVNGALSSFLPQLYGAVTLSVDNVPYEAVRRVYSPRLSGLTLDTKTVSADVQLALRGYDTFSGSVNVELLDFLLDSSHFRYGPSRVVGTATFSVSKASLESLRDVRIELEDLGSASGDIEFADSMPRTMNLRGATVDSAALIMALGLEGKVGDISGKLGIEAQVSRFADGWVPARATVGLKIRDEFDISGGSEELSYVIRGLTGGLNVNLSFRDDVLSAAINGKLLPEVVTLGDKRLFLSAQNIETFGKLSYDGKNATLSVGRLRLESETGLVEEVTGKISKLDGTPVLNLKFKDWGLTLEQVLAVVEIPEDMKVKGGNFILERFVSGELGALRSEYKITVNNLTVSADKIRLEGAGLLLEFP
ncbi:MAG: hypothetical protein U5N86_08990 [Planctomycetota bacterium]|nr:hypothetical protein [Planctomycetota bacterium]